MAFASVRTLYGLRKNRGPETSFVAIVVIQIREVAGITRILQISDGRMVASSRISGTTVGIEIKMAGSKCIWVVESMKFDKI